ncbi:MAG: tRNA 2-thiouridine(34) synthase MnmA [Planctomycetaceae bacterium]
MTRVVLAMSGGVDSSVAAHLLLEAGHEVVGVFMRHGEASANACKIENVASGLTLPVVTAHDAGGRADHKQGCCSATDAADARRVAAKLKIPFYSLDLQSDFRRIVDYFVDDYMSGRTPNPCVKCNHWIKFGRLFDFAEGVEAEYVATGHYARLERDDTGSWLCRGLDGKKDQSYALFGIAPDRLARMLLPVGDYEKPKIRELAAQIGLNVAAKKDSQEICFVTQGHHSDFVKARRGEMSASTAGPIVTIDGKHVGNHDGYEAYTVGQRKGLGIAMGEPHFVVRIEPESRQVVIGPRQAMMRRGLVAHEANWFIAPPSGPLRCQVQIRYNADAADAWVSVNELNQFTVEFDVAEAGVAPGQAAVIYQGNRVLGGGWIHSSFE